MPDRRSLVYIRKADSGRGTYKQRERIIQRSLAGWLRQNLPNVDFYNDWASGAYLDKGQNSARLTLASPNGWVDLFIAEPRRGYHGLFIELKKEGVRPYLKNGNVCADAQIRKEHSFLLRQERKGYCARFACGEEQALKLICWYFEIERPEPMELF